MASERLDEQIRSLVTAGATELAVTLVLRELGPEVLGFLSGALGDVDADDVFSTLSERLWRSLHGFEGRCSIRTWTYVLARRELGRFRKRARRRANDHVPLSDLADVLAVARSSPALAIDRQRRLAALRDELSIEDRALLILRVDRDLAWDEIALVFAELPEAFNDEDRKRESTRLRKRFQLVKQRLLARVRDQEEYGR